jgi:hypothetical protein
MALMRVVCNEDGDYNGSKSNGDEGGRRATAMATRAMAMVTLGKQQSTSSRINKCGQWLAREHRQGDHRTTTVGDNEQQERVADDDGSNEEGKGGQGDGDGNEGSGRQRGQGQ